MKSPRQKTFLKINWIIALTVVCVTWVNFNQERWKYHNVIESDVANYYSYLPAIIYEKDLSLSFLYDTKNVEIESKLYKPNFTSKNKPVIKMSIGMAYTYLPFFGLAHFYAKSFDYPIDGYSAPYQFAIQFSTLFYYCLGLWFLWGVLRFYFSKSASFLTLIFLTFGTNIYYYLTIGAGMSHASNFALIAAFLYYTIQWHNSKSFKTILLVGVIGGLLTLIRPINILIFLFFLFYDVSSFKDLLPKLKMLLFNKIQLLVLVLLVFLIFVPQLLYWHYVTGHFFFNSYVDEGFYFNKPHVLEAIFGFRKGWLIYTPIMIFSLVGFFIIRLKQFIISIPLFFVIYLYVTFSWWCWWYGGSFGQRPLIDIYPLLGIPFAAFLTAVQSKSQIKQRLIYTLLGLFTLLNLFQTIQAKYNIIHYDSMTRENYFQVFFTITKKADRENYLIHPNYEKAKRGEEEN